MRLKALKYLGLSAVLAEPLGWREWCTLAEDDTLFEAGFVMARNQRPPTHKLELVAWQKHKPAPAYLLKITYCSHWLLILSFLFHTFFCSHFVCLTLSFPRVCTVTSASWSSSLKRPTETCSAGWHWARSWTARRRSPPPRNLMRRRRPNSPVPGGTLNG